MKNWLIIFLGIFGCLNFMTTCALLTRADQKDVEIFKSGLEVVPKAYVCNLALLW